MTVEEVRQASREYGPKRTTVNGDLTEQYDPITIQRIKALKTNNKFVSGGMNSLGFNVAVPTQRLFINE